jgi:hypothetical protein
MRSKVQQRPVVTRTVTNATCKSKLFKVADSGFISGCTQGEIAACFLEQKANRPCMIASLSWERDVIGP